MKDVHSIDLNAHDDDFKINKIDDLEISNSKYTEYQIKELTKSMNIDYSHDDDFSIDKSSDELVKLNFNGKYTDLKLPLPSNKSYHIKGNLKYGDLKYPKAGITETRYVKDGNDLEIEGVAADGSSTLKVNIEAHDCKINLEQY